MNDFKSTIYRLEDKFLSPYACKSQDTKGRRQPAQECPLRTDFARDRDRIIHSKAFRRLKHKTQVFLSPEGDHYRTRLTHTLEVSQIARSIARGLRLNEDLTEAIALGHDLGHTPYGHAGERALNDFTPFRHNEQSLRMCDVLEKDGTGLNLTFEVRDGILNHRTGMTTATLEASVVALSDKIAYINHDIDDAARAGIISENDIPKGIRDGLGDTHGRRINNMIMDIIHNSLDRPVVVPSKEMQGLMGGLRQFLFDTVYISPVAKAEEGKAVDMVKYLYNYYINRPELLPDWLKALPDAGTQKVCDYISMFTDRYCVRVFQDITVPKNWGTIN